MLLSLLTRAHQRIDVRAQAALAPRAEADASSRGIRAPLHYFSARMHEVDGVLPKTRWVRRVDSFFGDGSLRNNGRIDASLARGREQLEAGFQSLCVGVPSLRHAAFVGPALGAACGLLVRTASAALGLVLKISARFTLLGASLLTGGRYPQSTSVAAVHQGFSEQMADAQRTFEKVRLQTPMTRIVTSDFVQSVLAGELQVTLSYETGVVLWRPAKHQPQTELSEAERSVAADAVAASWSGFFRDAPSVAFAASYFAAPAMFERLNEIANWSRTRNFGAEPLFYSLVGARQTLRLDVDATGEVRTLRLCLTLNQEASFDGSVHQNLASPLHITLTANSAACLSTARLSIS